MQHHQRIHILAPRSGLGSLLLQELLPAFIFSFPSPSRVIWLLAECFLSLFPVSFFSFRFCSPDASSIAAPLSSPSPSWHFADAPHRAHHLPRSRGTAKECLRFGKGVERQTYELLCGSQGVTCAVLQQKAS